MAQKFTNTFTAFMLASVFAAVARADYYIPRYHVKPVELSDGYSITGGFIDYAGGSGPMQEYRIWDYEFVVTGPVPHTFRPSNPGTITIDASGPVVSYSSIMLPIDTDPSNQNFNFELREIVGEGDSMQWFVLYYSNSLYSPISQDSSFVAYIHYDGDVAHFGTSRIRPQVELTIAAKVVPEPATAILATLAASCLFWRITYRK